MNNPNIKKQVMEFAFQPTKTFIAYWNTGTYYLADFLVYNKYDQIYFKSCFESKWHTEVLVKNKEMLKALMASTFSTDIAKIFIFCLNNNEQPIIQLPDDFMVSNIHQYFEQVITFHELIDDDECAKYDDLDYLVNHIWSLIQ